MLAPLWEWSQRHLGQWHYVLGYLITLVTHNWPLFGAIGLIIWGGIRLMRCPNRPNACLVFAGICIVAAYEYNKHVALQLHEAVEFLFYEWSGLHYLYAPLHFIIGPLITTVLFASGPAWLAGALFLSREHLHVRFGSMRALIKTTRSIDDE